MTPWPSTLVGDVLGLVQTVSPHLGLVPKHVEPAPRTKDIVTVRSGMELHGMNASFIAGAVFVVGTSTVALATTTHGTFKVNGRRSLWKVCYHLMANQFHLLFSLLLLVDG